MSDISKAGLVFPSSGYPYYYCIVTERIPDKTKSMEKQEKSIEILKEGEGKTIIELKKDLEKFKDKKCETVYIDYDKKFVPYIRDINRWKVKENVKIRFKQTNAMSFESSILKIKEFIVEKRIIFPIDSTIKNQLSIFSKLSLKEQEEYYAVNSLCLVIGSVYGKEEEKEVEPDVSSWY